jgi:hypothetical protein
LYFIPAAFSTWFAAPLNLDTEDGEEEEDDEEAGVCALLANSLLATGAILSFEKTLGNFKV